MTDETMYVSTVVDTDDGKQVMVSVENEDLILRVIGAGVQEAQIGLSRPSQANKLAQGLVGALEELGRRRPTDDRMQRLQRKLDQI